MLRKKIFLNIEGFLKLQEQLLSFRLLKSGPNLFY